MCTLEAGNLGLTVLPVRVDAGREAGAHPVELGYLLDLSSLRGLVPVDRLDLVVGGGERGRRCPLLLGCGRHVGGSGRSVYPKRTEMGLPNDTLMSCETSGAINMASLGWNADGLAMRGIEMGRFFVVRFISRKRGIYAGGG